MEKWLKLYAVGLYTFLAERLSVVCDIGAPYSDSLTFRQFIT